MTTPSSGGIVGNLAGNIGHVNDLLAGALTAVATFKAARDAWKAAHPDATEPIPDDHQLVELLRMDAAALVAHVDQVIAKHSGGTPPAAPAAVTDPGGG
jgi:hypothetical protein